MFEHHLWVIPAPQVVWPADADMKIAHDFGADRKIRINPSNAIEHGHLTALDVENEGPGFQV
jgi:hypothetical protein